MSSPPLAANDGGASPATEPTEPVASATRSEPAAVHESASGCGCRVARRSVGSRAALLAFGCLLLGMTRRATRRRRAKLA
jgi:hypothetical protein